jgi:hypothetical protein
LLPYSLGVRPMLDVLWTQSAQSGADPRWRNCTRKNVRHDLTLAVLSTGPVGFGDLAHGNGTDADLLRRAIRYDGVILKPAAPILRVDRWYSSTGGAEVWATVSGPAHSDDARTDRIANSMASLAHPPHMSAGAPAALWWRTVLATNVDGTSASGVPLALSELWPTPPASAVFLAARIDSHVGGVGDGAGPVEGVTRCVAGQPAASCVREWSAHAPLDVSTPPASGVLRSYALWAAAPVLSSGWTLLGELNKLVPASPQRLLAKGDADAPSDADLRCTHTDDAGADDARGDGARGDGAGDVCFDVMGASGEEVALTLVAPPPANATPLDGLIVEVRVTLGPSARAHVRCAAGACAAVQAE